MLRLPGAVKSRFSHVMPLPDMPTTAMVLAAGYGKRMRPVTDIIPKPMVEVAGRSLIHRVLDQLVVNGIRKAVVNLSYKGEQLREHLEGRNAPELVFSIEDTPLETGGGIAKALPLLGNEPFFVANSDVIFLDGTVPTLHRLAQHWDPARMDALLLLVPSVRAYGYHGQGDFFLNPKGVMRRRKEHEVAPFVFTGIQLMHPRLFKDAPSGAFSLNVLYNRNVVADGSIERIFGISHDGAWLHVGDPRSFAFAENYLRE